MKKTNIIIVILSLSVITLAAQEEITLEQVNQIYQIQDDEHQQPGYFLS